MSNTEPEPHFSDDSDAEAEEQFFLLLSAARSAYEVAEEALQLFEERRPSVIQLPPGRGLVVSGLQIEWSHSDSLTRRGLIGAHAFISNIVVIEKCIRRMQRLADLPDHIQKNVVRSLTAIQSVADRRVRNSNEHVDERAVQKAALVSATIFEGDRFGATDPDGTLVTTEVSRRVLDAVAQALDGVVWSPEAIQQLLDRRSARSS